MPRYCIGFSRKILPNVGTKTKSATTPCNHLHNQLNIRLSHLQTLTNQPYYDKKVARPADTTQNFMKDGSKLDNVVSNAILERDIRQRGYRAQSLRIHPWICVKCARQFSRQNLYELTVHHKDHNHDNNPRDGSNWEHLCVYCHDNEHARHHDAQLSKKEKSAPDPSHTHKSLAHLSRILENTKKS